MMGLPTLSERTSANHPPTASFEYVESRSIRLADARSDGLAVAVPKIHSGRVPPLTSFAACNAARGLSTSIRGLTALNPNSDAFCRSAYTSGFLLEGVPLAPPSPSDQVMRVRIFTV